MNIDDDLNIIILDNDHSAKCTLQYQLGNNCKQAQECSQNNLERSDPYDLTIRQQIFRTQYYQFIPKQEKQQQQQEKKSEKLSKESFFVRWLKQEGQILPKKQRFDLFTLNMILFHIICDKNQLQNFQRGKILLSLFL
ncbi:hypothetical protein pb186bvf_001502 [Paramecium bursaria]